MHRVTSHGKVILTHFLIISMLGFIAAAATQYRRQKLKAKRDPNVIPRLDRTESGRVGSLESFPHYVARQMGFSDPNECPQLCKLAYDYLKRSEGCEANILNFFGNEPEAKSLIEEFERCILSYFAFHWSKTSLIISQVLNVESEKGPKLKSLVMEATRQRRFELAIKDLKVKRAFSTLVEEMKAIAQPRPQPQAAESQRTEVMVSRAPSERSPVLLLVGGGMGAGKSTVIKNILDEPFWSEAKAKAVVVEADAFKESDVIFQALNSMGYHDDMIHTAELVHQSSITAASSLLVTALNEGRDVIMDGTLSWEPFVRQTISMARNVHNHRYRMGVGYKVEEDGTIIENYWEQVKAEEDQQQNEEDTPINRKPYRIELVGVVCDAFLAVVRGIRRAIITGRAVRVKPQLESHKRFAEAFTTYSQLVDYARLICTNSLGGPPKLITREDPEEMKCLSNVGNIQADADSIYELYKDPSPIYEPGSIWTDIILSPIRPDIQLELKTWIQNVEKINATSTNIFT